MRFLYKVFFPSILLLMLTGQAAVAKQLSFNKTYHQGHVSYSYQFTMFNGEISSLDFNIDRKLTEKARRHFVKIDQKKLAKKIDQEAEQIFNKTQDEYIQEAKNVFAEYVNEKIAAMPETSIRKIKGLA